MRICVYGAGAIGGHLAVRLGQVPGNRVQVVARGAHLAAIRERGLTLRFKDTPLHARVEASDDIRAMPPPDVVIVTLKAHSVARAADDLVALARGGARMAFVINGIPWWYPAAAAPPLSRQARDRIDPAGLAACFDLTRVAGGVVYSPNTIVEPGVIDCAADYTRLIFGPVQAGHDHAAREAAALFAAAGVTSTHVPDLRPEIFAKLLRNSGLNPLCALTASTTRDVTSDPVLRRFCMDILREVVGVAASQGVSLAVDEDVFDPTRMAPHKASMAQDLEAGRPLEADGILGNVQVLAREAGIATPALDLVTALLLARARGNVSR